MNTIRTKIFYTLCITFLLMALPAINMFAQGNRTVNGKVTDMLGEPLPGVSILLKGSQTGTITNLDGQFTINVSGSDAVLVFSYIGYATQEVKVGNNTAINVKLSEDTSVLDEVVVVGYGIQKKVNLSGSVSTVSADKIANRPAMNFSSSLAGLAPGLNVVQGSGNPGSESVSFAIRGVGSINANSPLIMVDGIVADMQVINPEDVESVSILKDAASAAIYGSRGANGVILVTTKKGKKEAPKVTFSAMLASTHADTSLEFMSSTADFMYLHNIAVTNTVPGTALRFSEATIDDWRAADANPNGVYTHPVTGREIPNWLAYPNTDWAQVMFKPAFYHRYGVSVSGGSDTSNYMLSGSFQDNPGSLENTGMQRYNIRANVESKIRDFLTIGTQTWATKEFKDPGDVAMTYLTQAYPAINPKHEGLFGASEDTNMANMNNPLHSIASRGGEREFTRINTTWYAIANLWKGLSFEAKINYNEYQRQDKTFSQNIGRYRFRDGTDAPVEAEGDLNLATTYRYSYFSRSYTANFFLRYMAQFGDHDISALAAYEQYYTQSTGFSLTAKGLMDWNVVDIVSASEMQDWGKDAPLTQLGMLSYFGRINYGYKGKYLLEMNVRADGSSKFAPGHRWGTFPSFSGAWRVSEEAFFTPLKKYVDNFKLKASYGKLGSQVGGNYDWQSIYRKVNNVFDEQVKNGIIQSQVPNYNLSWETTASTNVGFEANLLNQRLNVEVEYFTRKTTDMLVTPPTYQSIGTVGMPRINQAELKAQGVDFTLGWNDRIGDFRYSANLIAGYSSNEVTKFKGALVYGLDETVLDIWGNPTWRYTNLNDVSGTGNGGRVVEGHAVGEYYLHKPYSGSGTYFLADGTVNPNGGPKDGMIRTKADLDWVRAMVAAKYDFNSKVVGPGSGQLWYGDMIMADLNGDGKYGNANDNYFTGKSQTPKWILGLNLSATWKGIDLTMSWSGRFGSYHLISERGTVGSSLSNNTDVLPKDAYSKFYFYNSQAAKDDANYDPATDPDASIHGKYPRLLTIGSIGGSSNLHYLFNSSFIKLKNMQIGYTFPRKMLQAAKINNLRIFVTGENLLNFKHKDFPGVDPELGATILAYPISKTYSGGVSITF